MALTRNEKNEVVDEVTQLLKESKLTVVAKYQGTSVKSMQELRKSSRDNGTRVVVIKNRLFKKAAEADERFKDTDLNALTGQLMYAFNSEDEVAPAQSLANFAKNEPQIEFVAALTAEGKLLPPEEVKVLASLPSKNQLIAQTVTMLLSPVNDVTNALSGNLHALLDGVSAKAA
jgi:large subunit ribosomal protein L10